MSLSFAQLQTNPTGLESLWRPRLSIELWPFPLYLLVPNTFPFLSRLTDLNPSLLAFQRKLDVFRLNQHVVFNNVWNMFSNLLICSNANISSPYHVNEQECRIILKSIIGPHLVSNSTPEREMLYSRFVIFSQMPLKKQVVLNWTKGFTRYAKIVSTMFGA